MKYFYFSLAFFLIAIFSIFTNWYQPLSLILSALLLTLILYKIGKGIVLMEVTALMYAFTCLLMPIVGYKFYSIVNDQSRLWVRFMPVKADVYFSYVLPAISFFCLFITLPSFKKVQPDEGKKLLETFSRLKEKLEGQKHKGLYIMISGILISLIANFLPQSMTFFATLFYFGSFAGFLYIYFTPSLQYKLPILLMFGIFIAANALQTGMFTIVAYMGITIFSFFQVGKKSSIFQKFFLLLLVVSFFIVLQNVKIGFRKSTWGKQFEGNKAELFSDLFMKNVQKGEYLLTKEAFFPLYVRANQGYNIALVMRRIPTTKPYDNGSRLFTVFLSAFVPRFFWSDKPEAGGKFNMYYYAGWVIKKWSTNVGPLGEAYGSFGIWGGVIYMSLLGLFLRWVYLKVFKIIKNIPLIICWLPVLFYQVTSSAETDTLSILNSIIKSAFFIWLLTKVLPGWFGIERGRSLQHKSE